ncbi:hypothetical protein DL93DRAFT_424509 [Clavulina sp. PMI_390]|nr:hypothetical protein DL93DRAFT_424509 [Clavulina sp. PMI_390]
MLLLLQYLVHVIVLVVSWLRGRGGREERRGVESTKSRTQKDQKASRTDGRSYKGWSRYPGTGLSSRSIDGEPVLRQHM